VIPRLHLVTDDEVIADPRFLSMARAALEAGGRRVALHLRGPGTAGSALWSLGSTLVDNARSHGAILLVNDRVDLAMVLGADGAHLGARSLPVGTARSLLGDRRMIGRSVHDRSAVVEVVSGASPGRGVDFLAAGSIYSTASHPGRPGIGVQGLQAMVDAAGAVPVVAIGGITPDRVGELLEGGAHGVAVLGAVWKDASPGAAVHELLDAVEAPRGTDRRASSR
jgi:thiamine-phosphate diphosphorylase